MSSGLLLRYLWDIALPPVICAASYHKIK
jgi:hypothetical protein